MSTQQHVEEPSELSDDELLERIAATDTPLAEVAEQTLEADTPQDEEVDES